MRYKRVALAVFLVVALDQITKSIAVAKLTRGKPVRLLGELLQFDLVSNSGGSFSLFEGSTAILAIAAMSVSCYLIYLIRITDDKATIAALASLLSGASGNIVDRLFRQPGPLRGEVIDFIALPNWPNFNVADMAVTFGGILLAYRILRLGRSATPSVEDTSVGLSADD